MKKTLIAATGLLALSVSAMAQTDFKTTPGGLKYKIGKDVPGTQTPKVGDFVEMHIHTHIGDSSLFDSRKVNKDKPVPWQVPPSAFKGDLTEGLTLLSVGDSATFLVPLDSMLKMGVQPLPWMKKDAGMMFQYDVVMVSVKTPEQVKKEQEEHAAKQVAVDDKLLNDYFTKNKIKATKTASGLYYKIEKTGTGENAKAGQNVTVNYTGKTIDGTTFDSNVDPKFNHVSPFAFGLGQGQVIKGWDEGVALLKKGGKATLYIPSNLAYGERSPSPLIPENSVLIFDVEVTEIK